MKAYHHLIAITSILSITSCHPVSYSKVKFVLGPETNIKKSFNLNRNARSFGHHFPVPLTFPEWNTGFDGFLDEVIFPPPTLSYLDVQFERGHITPDYSNGLAYPDPLLLTGKQALLAVKYLYGRGELFYNQIPHVRALLNNQEERRRNGLDGHYLSSNRPSSPFFRT